MNYALDTRKYNMALAFVMGLDRHLRDGTRIYRHKDGRLLTDLGEIVEVIIKGELREDES